MGYLQNSGGLMAMGLPPVILAFAKPGLTGRWRQPYIFVSVLPHLGTAP